MISWFTRNVGMQSRGEFKNRSKEGGRWKETITDRANPKFPDVVRRTETQYLPSGKPECDLFMRDRRLRPSQGWWVAEVNWVAEARHSQVRNKAQT